MTHDSDISFEEAERRDQEINGTAHQNEVGNGETRIHRQLRLVAFKDIVLTEQRRDLVKGLIPRVGLTVVWGPPKCGKSFWVFDIAMHIALNWNYRGRRVQQGPVVYCAFEGQSGIEARVEAFRQRFNIDRATDVPFYLEPVSLMLVQDHPRLIKVITEQLASVKPEAIVLDTLNRSFQGSESSDEDMSAYVRAADALREEFECAVIIVHHCGHDTTRPRGHTALAGAADAQISVKKDSNNSIVAKVEWMKDGPESEDICSRLDVVEVGLDLDGETITSCVVVEAEASTGNGRSQLRGAAKVALTQLDNALADHGENPPASNHVPPNLIAVRANIWRDYCYKSSVTDSDKPASKNKAFNRALKELQATGTIGIWDDWVWRT